MADLSGLAKGPSRSTHVMAGSREHAARSGLSRAPPAHPPPCTSARGNRPPTPNIAKIINSTDPTALVGAYKGNGHERNGSGAPSRVGGYKCIGVHDLSTERKEFVRWLTYMSLRPASMARILGIILLLDDPTSQGDPGTARLAVGTRARALQALKNLLLHVQHRHNITITSSRCPKVDVKTAN